VLVPSPKWLDTGDNAWQLAAATFVALQSIPGLTVLYGGVVKKKWAINSAFMSIYAFASVLVVWVLFDYNMAFGEQWFPFLGKPMPALSAAFSTGQATIPAAASGMPPIQFPMATLVYFQFVFAAITVIILAGSVLGRMSFTAWMWFCPLWMTLVYTVGAFSLWGGGWLASMGVVDFSGGYVIHLAAASSGFVAAAMVGPRLQQDREHFPPNSLLITLVGGGILWIGWNGFNGGDPYFAGADATAAVVNTNLATAVAMMTWIIMDMSFGKDKKPTFLGGVNGMICGLVAITPCAGWVNGQGAIYVGAIATVVVWVAWNFLSKVRPFSKVDDALGVVYTHGMAGLLGGLLLGIFGDPGMIQYPCGPAHVPLTYASQSTACAPFSVSGLIYTGSAHQLWEQTRAAVFVILWSAVITFILMKLIGLVLRGARYSDEVLEVGDLSIHGEEAFPTETLGERVGAFAMAGEASAARQKSDVSASEEEPV